MAHTITGKKGLLTRVRRIAGQVAALERALESEAECAGVLQQIAAIRGATNGLMAEVLEGHVREHLGDPSHSPETREADMDLVIDAVRRYIR
ncbi:metal/formaldehyde-sensitive transcriptional repressor [Roseateles chitosanitabidus]|uniref:metal/formaldehyde-sensitive transcriptional repressor n=1 Tax=Roseateles chitosanitabidus TaxID=65048 RepID=UPI0008309CBE|nr:metal/formaldehyde-sensitive transcriptional repressor [Roseateles chitosanitabidus]MBO9687591.1 metal/formaldehyde-sensitive transcriptional repressor [Roseateles chitosanitabidus]